MSNDGSTVIDRSWSRVLQLRVGRCVSLNRRELAIDQRAEVRQRTPRVYERDGQLPVRASRRGAAPRHPGRRAARPAPTAPGPGRPSPTGEGGGSVRGACPVTSTAVRYPTDSSTTSVARIRSPGALPDITDASLTLNAIVIAWHEALDVAVLDRQLLPGRVDRHDLPEDVVGRRAGAAGESVHRAITKRTGMDTIARTRPMRCTLLGRNA